MNYFAQAGVLLIEFVIGILTAILVLRLLLQLVRGDFYNPISQFLYQATNPVLIPMRKLLPPLGRLDTAGALLAWLLQVLKVLLLYALSGQLPTMVGLLVLGLAHLLGFVLTLLLLLIVVRIIVGWIALASERPTPPLLLQLTEPLLRPIRRRLPYMGGFDLSPMLVILLLLLASILLAAPLFDLGQHLARG